MIPHWTRETRYSKSLVPLPGEQGRAGVVIMGSWVTHFRDEASQCLRGLWGQLANLPNKSQG